MNLIIEIFDIIEKHKKSPFEFKKQEKVVILSENSLPKIIIIDHAKQYLALAKRILEKTKKIMINKF